MLKPGKPNPLGAHLTPQGVNFSLFSVDATRVEVCIFDTSGAQNCHELPGHTGNIWHGLLPGAKAGLEYGYRVHGPWCPHHGLRYNPAKLLLDPYARALTGKLPFDYRLCGGVNTPDEHDNLELMPRCIVLEDAYDWGDDHPPLIPWGKSIIYEAHVRGLTASHPDIPKNIRGSYAALSHPIMMAHFKHLGITALELLPIQLHTDEPRLQQLGLCNYWGYNVLAPFAIEPRYASSRPDSQALNEFRDTVKILHKAGMEVILDVVFNHTAELDVEGPMTSLRGIDNRHYYWCDAQGQLQNWTGCGNTLQLTQPHTVQWVMDCLRHWVQTCHVDGFRFDLGSVCGRTPEFNPHSPLLIAMAQDPLLAEIKLIVEPWDIGPGGYQVGSFPLPFSEWNDHYRDEIRRFWLQSDLKTGNFAKRFAASSDLFCHHHRAPSSSINQITTHDGFTLRDLVSFNQKHNQANQEANLDGTNNNYSNNHGVEGLEASEAIIQQRKRTQRALLATLLLSQGTPMLLAGDEIGHSQQGNNNAYCQDNELTWLSWTQADKSLTDYTAALIHLRQSIPALTRDQWWDLDDDNVCWLNAKAHPMTQEEWEASPPVLLQIQLSTKWLIIVNPSHFTCDIQLPSGEWQAPAPFEPLTPGDLPLSWQIAARTVCVLISP